jgi:hypothetical protein
VSDLANSILVAVATGVVSSFAVWWWLTRWLRPRIRICPTLATFISADGGRRTQFRIRNDGRRDAYDISIRVSLRMPALIAPGVIEWALLREEYLTALPAGASRRWSINPQSAEALDIYWKHMPNEIRDRRESGLPIRLEDLFVIPRATLRVAVFATDSYSGGRQYVEVTFDSGCVKSGRFLGEGCDHAPSETWLRGDDRERGEEAAGTDGPPSM